MILQTFNFFFLIDVFLLKSPSVLQQNKVSFDRHRDLGEADRQVAQRVFSLRLPGEAGSCEGDAGVEV